jgi:predicted phage tail component-like protein
LNFKNAHSYNDHKLIMQSTERNLLPEVKRQQVDILSIDGKFDLQTGTPVYENRIITVRLTYQFTNLPDLTAKRREVAQWLSGRGHLIFDDEPSKYYDAKVFSAIAVVQTFKTLTLDVAFECKPFAYGATVTTPITLGATALSYAGNMKSPTLIRIENTGTIAVSQITITAVNRASGHGIQ